MTTFGSVRSGIEAASVAWEPLGMRAAWLAEVDPFPSAVLAYRYPDVPNLGDMTALPRRILTGDIAAPDVLVGGTPCQSFSIAGMREGLTDERGQLTIKYVETLDAIDAIRYRAGKPAAIGVWENVPGVLSDKNNAFGCFLGALAGEDSELRPAGKKWTNAGCVYGPQRTVAWRVLDAQYFGVAQRRRRVFVVASARDGFDPAAVLFEREGVRRDSPPSRESRENAAADVASSAAYPILEPGARTGKSTTDKRAGLGVGGGADPMFTLQAGKQHGVAVPFDKKRIGEYGSGTLASTCAARDYKDATDLIVQAVTVHGTQDPICSDTVAHALGRNSGQKNALVVPSLAVRRLTPVECERLQGFPDGWTDVPYRNKPSPADGNRYKAIGNSMAVPVMHWIGRRIITATKGDENDGY